MSGSSKDEVKTSGGLFEASGLMAQLLHVRKRKRAFGGQAVDMDAVRRSVDPKRQKQREQ